jgi:hypothetical protein
MDRFAASQTRQKNLGEEKQMTGTQTILGRSALVFGLVVAAACATSGTGPGAGNRKDFGHVEVYTDPPVTNTVVIDHFDFRVEQLRVSEGAPGNANNFAYSLEEDGCLHGQQLQKFCRVPAAKEDRPELSRWRATASIITFATTLSPDGKTLVVEARALVRHRTCPARQVPRRWRLAGFSLRRRDGHKVI